MRIGGEEQLEKVILRENKKNNQLNAVYIFHKLEQYNSNKHYRKMYKFICCKVELCM